MLIFESSSFQALRAAATVAGKSQPGNSAFMFSFAFSTLTADSATFTNNGSATRLNVSTPVVSPSTFSKVTGCENSMTKKSFWRRAQPTEWR